MKFLPQKFGFLCVLCVLCGDSLCFGLDREAFSITNYDLNLQIEPEQHRLGARGKITLRNDRDTLQKIAILQISSSLDWRAIRVGDKTVQFVTQPYTSDIDHTGALSEAIITLRQEVAPHASVDLDIAYEGVMLPDATRLIRIGTPEDVAKNSDWDRIDPDFTVIRGAGYVAWYPITTEVANLSDRDSLFEVLGRWKQRQRGAKIHLNVDIEYVGETTPQILFGGMLCTGISKEHGSFGASVVADCHSQPFRLNPPALIIAGYSTLEKPAVEVHFLKNHSTAAEKFADTAGTASSLVEGWFGTQRERAQVAELPDSEAAAFESGVLLLTPLRDRDSTSAGLSAAHQLTHASFLSFRPWIEEGLAHFTQALYVEQQKGRQAALDYMGLHRTVLAHLERTSTAVDADQENDRSLINNASEELYGSKALSVWWMLRDMIGDAALKKAISSYKAEQDNDPSYMPGLIAAQTQRDLQWFFDDWIYHDRGLPEFKVESAFASKMPASGFLLTITLDNLGTAGAEVPVIIKFTGGEVTKRIEVRAKSKATVRVETPGAPQEIHVNDGSVPESNPNNNVFKVEPPAIAK